MIYSYNERSQQVWMLEVYRYYMLVLVFPSLSERKSRTTTIPGIIFYFGCLDLAAAMHAWSPPELHPCLLYTSDAADE